MYLYIGIFCLFYRFLDTFILICLLSYKNYIPGSLLYKIYISVYFSTHCLLFSDLIFPVGKIAQKLDPQIVQYAKTNKNHKNILTIRKNKRIVKSVKRTSDRHSVLSVLNISFLIHNFIVDNHNYMWYDLNKSIRTLTVRFPWLEKISQKSVWQSHKIVIQ